MGFNSGFKGLINIAVGTTNFAPLKLQVIASRMQETQVTTQIKMTEEMHWYYFVF